MSFPPAGASPRLYTTPSSYYSMIARLALAEARIPYTPIFTDIHARLAQQRTAYVRLNPNMTVPTLVLPGRILTESRDIALFALNPHTPPSAEEQAWLDLHYALPIEELTFGRLLAANRLARFMVPRILARARRLLLHHAAQTPDLAPLYEARAALFAHRIHTFDPSAVIQLAQQRQAQALDILTRMQTALNPNHPTLSPTGYGIADTVLTVFLARIAFTGLTPEIQSRPALAQYWQTMQSRPSFTQADIWTRFHPLRALRAIALSH